MSIETTPDRSVNITPDEINQNDAKGWFCRISWGFEYTVSWQ